MRSLITHRIDVLVQKIVDNLNHLTPVSVVLEILGHPVQKEGVPGINIGFNPAPTPGKEILNPVHTPKLCGSLDVLEGEVEGRSIKELQTFYQVLVGTPWYFVQHKDTPHGHLTPEEGLQHGALLREDHPRAGELLTSYLEGDGVREGGIIQESEEITVQG